MSKAFNKWLDTFVEEKGLDLEKNFKVEGPEYGLNIIPLGVVIEHIKEAPEHERKKIKNIIVAIDFKNGDVLHFFKHLAGAIAR